MNKLIEQLETLPEFSKLKAALKEKLNGENFYVQNFMQETGTFSEYRRDEGDTVTTSLSYCEAEEEGIYDLVNDTTGYFEEFITEEIREEAVEMMRALIKQMVIETDDGYRI